MPHKLTGLVAATHTPFQADGSLNLAIVEKQAEHLLRNNVFTIFIGGSTGECSSLTLEERRALTTRWGEVVRGTKLNLVVHVGSNCLSDAKVLATHAQQSGAVAVAALSPSYFKPRDLAALVAGCAEIAAAAPNIPYYFYDIPMLTGVNFSAAEFLELASTRIPNLAGLKFTNPDLMTYQLCLHSQGGRFDVPYGLDEFLLAALALGAKGAVGSTYNFAAPLYHRIWQAFEKSDFATARAEQFRAVQMIQLLAGLGFMGATKLVMKFCGVDVGPARLPNTNLSPEQGLHLRTSLEKLGVLPS